MTTEIIFLLDKSGSMAKIRNEVVIGRNAFVSEQQELAGDANFTMIQFSGEGGQYCCELKQRQNLADVRPWSTSDFSPNGGTPLLDAIGLTIESEGRRIAQEGRAERVIFVIKTDGEENTSRLYTYGRVKELIAHAEQHEWTFLFMGANINVQAYAANLGIASDRAYSFAANAAGTKSAYATLSAQTAQLRGTVY